MKWVCIFIPLSTENTRFLYFKNEKINIVQKNTGSPVVMEHTSIT